MENHIESLVRNAMNQNEPFVNMTQQRFFKDLRTSPYVLRCLESAIKKELESLFDAINSSEITEEDANVFVADRNPRVHPGRPV
jgi:hypothetical protein